MELSLLCDVNMFLFIYDKSQNRVIHYASDPNFNFTEIFNVENQREFYSNDDYDRVGGKKEGTVGQDDSASEAGVPDAEIKPKIFSQKRKEGLVTSRIGSLLVQKLPVPLSYVQVVSLQKESEMQTNFEMNKIDENLQALKAMQNTWSRSSLSARPNEFSPLLGKREQSEAGLSPEFEIKQEAKVDQEQM